MGHFITLCSGCTKTIAQCRCPSKDKTVRWELCQECAAESIKSPPISLGESLTPPFEQGKLFW